MKQLLLILLIMGTVLAQNNVLRMGYRTTEKLPLIAKSPDNSGLYLDLFTEATRRMGYTLEVVRLPKKRIILGMQDGTIDFYPVFVFSEERSEYTYFIPTGLYDQNVAITRSNFPEITSFADLDSTQYLQPLGNADHLENVDKSRLRIMKVPEASVKRIIAMLQQNHGDVSIYQRSTVEYYLKENKITDMRIHTKLLPEKINLPLGFSRLSPHFASVLDSSYNSQKELSPEHFPVTLTPECTAFKLQKVLEEMSADGYTDSLYNYYYGME